MTSECYPISILPHLSRLFLDFAEGCEALAPFFPAGAYSTAWMTSPVRPPANHRATLCDLLEQQNRSFGASDAALQNISRLRNGAGAVVTGQQVTLFGGPLFTLFKAATAIRKAADASASGRPHVPIFWLATEDHDLAEADLVVLPSRSELRTLRLAPDRAGGVPVGRVPLGDRIQELLGVAAEILGPGPLLDDLTRCYQPGATFGQAFAELILRIFAAHGLLVIDAASRSFHALGSDVLRAAIVRAEELGVALADRDRELAAAGYHSQVLVPPQSTLLFLIDGNSNARLALRRTAVPGVWQAGTQSYSTSDLLAILDSEPERLSPNALLRPVFQDAILPTATYIGGPAEIAYFAQSQVLYERILGRTTPVLPRLSATLIEPSVAGILAKHEVALPDVIRIAAQDSAELAHRLGERALPLEGRQKLAAADDALEEALSALSAYAQSLDAGLGRASDVAASKMRYQMNRIRQLLANHQLQREQSLRNEAQTLTLNLFPNRHPQERVLGAAWFLSRYGRPLLQLLIEQAGQQCPGHKALWI